MPVEVDFVANLILTPIHPGIRNMRQHFTFEVGGDVITEHLGNLFDSAELKADSVIRKFRTTAADGKNYNTQFYNLDAIIAYAGIPHRAHDIQTMPAATQDLSVVVASSIPATDVLVAVIEGAGELLEDARLVDIYEGAGVEEGSRSLTFALRFRATDRTLTAAEATASKDAGVALAASRFGATIRE
jgi:ferredoxin-fold anticodon binding domain-containing protein